MVDAYLTKSSRNGSNANSSSGHGTSKIIVYIERLIDAVPLPIYYLLLITHYLLKFPTPVSPIKENTPSQKPENYPKIHLLAEGQPFSHPFADRL